MVGFVRIHMHEMRAIEFKEHIISVFSKLKHLLKLSEDESGSPER